MSTVLEERPSAEDDAVRMQWRGSPDGIAWGPWNALHAIDEKVYVDPDVKFCQARIWIEDGWCTTPVTWWP